MTLKRLFSITLCLYLGSTAVFSQGDPREAEERERIASFKAEVDSLRRVRNLPIRIALAASVDSSLGDSSRAMGIKVLVSPRDETFVMIEFPLGVGKWQRKYLRRAMKDMLKTGKYPAEPSTPSGKVNNGVYISSTLAKRLLIQLEADLVRD